MACFTAKSYTDLALTSSLRAVVNSPSARTTASVRGFKAASAARTRDVSHRIYGGLQFLTASSNSYIFLAKSNSAKILADSVSFLIVYRLLKNFTKSYASVPKIGKNGAATLFASLNSLVVFVNKISADLFSNSASASAIFPETKLSSILAYSTAESFM